MSSIPSALTIAGSDSGGGAGIQADLKTFAAHDVHGVCAVTAVTAQNTVGVTTLASMSALLVATQIDTVMDDFDVVTIKTGMLATRAIVATVCDRLDARPDIPLVVDPVLVSTSGDRLLEEDALSIVRARLLPRACLVTPNRREAEVLTGQHIATPQQAVEAVARLREMGVGAVVLTGGDAPGPDAVDLFDDGATLEELRGPKLQSRATHGTGCTFAAAITAHLAQGASLNHAVASAKRYVEGGIRHAHPLGRGHGPLNHFWSK
ncbi:MAG: bifunctional hydroxymethylpyrimidine kinase/phosphomethylpyrimidine kinase [bacterium]